MDIIKIILIAMTAVILIMFVKQQRPEFAMLISISAGVIILLIALPYISSVFDLVGKFSAKTGLRGEYLETIIKVVGITYITQYGCEMCRDANEGALAAKLEMAGKIVILAMAVPIVSSLFDTIIKIIP